MPLLSLFHFETTLAAQPGDLIVNEVAWMGTQASASDEWIELFNPTSGDIDLTGWTLAAMDGTPSVALSGTIAAKGFFLLERTDDDTVKGVVADKIYTGALSNSGETLTLIDGFGNTIDTLNFAGVGWPAGDNTNKLTMERINALSGGEEANWANNDGVTRNGLDVGDKPINGTPKALNSVSNKPPTCNNATLDVVSGNVLSVDLSALCNDPEGDVLTFTTTSGPNDGTLNCSDSGAAACTYLPNAGFSGGDSFSFQAVDDFGGMAFGTVLINVTSSTFAPPSENFFVSSTSGSDANDGQTPMTAFATIQKGVDSAASGDTVLAENNWWGCNNGPSQTGCDSTLGLVDFSPWLIASCIFCVEPRNADLEAFLPDSGRNRGDGDGGRSNLNLERVLLRQVFLAATAMDVFKE